jgi:hypothetical protein
MKILNSKWVSFVCCCLNACFAINFFLSGHTNMFIMCTFFMVWCGYNFWNRMGEE